MKNMKELKVKMVFTEELLGLENAEDKDERPSNELRSTYTVFPRDEDGEPVMWDYQIKGFFKDACGMLRNVKGTESSKIKAFRREIDGLVFIKERQVKIVSKEQIKDCKRSLRISTPEGEKVTIAHSEMLPAGSTMEFTIIVFDTYLEKAVREWLDYGEYRGTGQWRNSGKGTFVWEEII